VTPWPVLLAACSVANLSYREVERDLDALVRVEGAGPDEKLVYETDVALAPWYARSYVLLPLKPLLMLGLPATTRNKLENPSEKVRELLVELAPKAGDDLGRAVASTRLLVRVAALDESALNRIAALDGLGCLAVAHGVDLVAGLTQGTRAPNATARPWPGSVRRRVRTGRTASRSSTRSTSRVATRATRTCARRRRRRCSRRWGSRSSGRWSTRWRVASRRWSTCACARSRSSTAPVGRTACRCCWRGSSVRLPRRPLASRTSIPT
jgi:hypothetical protein